MQILEKKGLNAKGNQITNMIDSYMVTVKKDGIIIGHLLQKKYLELAE